MWLEIVEKTGLRRESRGRQKKVIVWHGACYTLLRVEAKSETPTRCDKNETFAKSSKLVFKTQGSDP